MQTFTPDNDTTQRIAEHIQAILQLLGEDPQRQGLLRTPERVGKAFQYVTKGYQEDPEAILRSALFNNDSKFMLLFCFLNSYAIIQKKNLRYFISDRKQQFYWFDTRCNIVTSTRHSSWRLPPAPLRW